MPESALENVKLSMFNSGAGKMGNYSHCCWQVLGKGQFKPLDGSSPHIGSHGIPEQVEEYRVEMVCGEANIEAVIAALKASHPYEVPAYQVIRCENF